MAGRNSAVVSALLLGVLATSGGAAAPGARVQTEPVTLTDIRRDRLPDGVRITLALDGEAPFSSSQLANPPRVVIDLSRTRAVYALKDLNLAFGDEVVRQIRVGRQADATTRVVLDLAGAVRSSVYPVYNPYRLVVDVERASSTVEKRSPAVPRGKPASTATPMAARGTAGGPVPDTVARRPAGPDAPAAATTGVAAPGPPVAPAANTNGGFSLSRQLGLGIARIVIDAGHGGHDPGARSHGITEAELALDVALKLEKRLRERGVDVVLTRRTSAFIALDERTAVANRAGADLFLSIHANASENESARGIETYFLNFAPDAAAEAIAARENAGSSRTMKSLPETVRAIALNDKIDESRDFARFVQTGLVQGLKKANRQVRDLGVKQAPFQVLIGAAMPSILAEIAFITNEQEARLLKTDKYRDQIAEALFSGIMAYQGSLKKEGVVVKR